MSLAASKSPKNIVVIGGGIQGTSVAFALAERDLKVTVLEAVRPASAASGKGGGFMARSWGDGGPTEGLHHVAFDLYETLAPSLGCTSYRKLPVLSVSPGKSPLDSATKKRHGNMLPSWLDGNLGRVSVMGSGDDTAQITPSEFVEKMLEKHADRIHVVKGTCTGVTCTEQNQVSSVEYSDENNKACTLTADTVIVSAGPWSCAAEDWFDGALKLPMEGVKSTSIVWKKPESIETVDATALFCGEDRRFGTHLEVYPRPNGEIYICGIGGSDYISTEELKQGAFRNECNAKNARVKAAVASFQEMSSTYRQNGELERQQACMRPCPPDAMPYMGVVPGYSGAYINAGHNCWGIAWAPACGQAIAELILDGESKCVDLSPFDPARFTPAAQRGERGRKRQGTSVGEQW
ncbi:hypothetical protein FisN_3Lh084 [Fistulifera solaris]|uniref:FAD dependent oxidoreductase domain-containing protein n=1 Tax=Fistulifera solaris TaxID=1519565 RepID=A0A1Z5JZ41_FISSO|nr:hypothetical protein FisN_3Lh084 [Fistulifera solaris]|eukprot:GAX19142.1 hypothetical protein FisN_3Lh084 [Fistulifera solaris]